MFKGLDESTAAKQQGVPVFPALVPYDVKVYVGTDDEATTILRVEGHSCQIMDGCLVIHRGIFLDPDCTQPGVVISGSFAAGEWISCKTDYTGYERRSELSILH